MSDCGVHYTSAILDWLLTAVSFIMHVKNEVPETIFSVWLHEYTKRLGFLCASNQTINVSIPCLDYRQGISICSVLDSYQCLLFEFSYKKGCDSVYRVVPSNMHYNLANKYVRIILFLVCWWINVTFAKIKIQLN